MDNRTKIAAAWWTNALRESYQKDGSASRSTQAGALSDQQLEAFEAALAREISFMLTQDLTHVLAVNHHRAAPQFTTAASSCGIEGIAEMLPNETVMRIFPETVMTRCGPRSQMEILWTSNDLLKGGKSAKTGKDAEAGKDASAA